jgi:hypothetical protein
MHKIAASTAPGIHPIRNLELFSIDFGDFPVGTPIA